jgi:SAM-dependent methyltransferase
MSHPEQANFVASVRDRFPRFFTGVRVLEIGSRDINGSVREYFSDCDYTGLDCSPGPGVDVVALAHQYDSPDPFDVVVCCEVFEHDPHFRATLANALRLLRPGGLFVATWAAPTRPEHGTTRTGEPYGPDPDYYRGIGGDEFLAAVEGLLNLVEIWAGQNGEDVYALGFRTGAHAARSFICRAGTTGYILRCGFGKTE